MFVSPRVLLRLIVTNTEYFMEVIEQIHHDHNLNGNLKLLVRGPSPTRVPGRCWSYCVCAVAIRMPLCNLCNLCNLYNLCNLWLYG